MKLDEIQQQLELPIRGYVAAKRTSLDSRRGCCQWEDFAWTKVAGGIRCWPRCPEFVKDRERVNATDHALTTARLIATARPIAMARPIARSAMGTTEPHPTR